MDICLLPIGAYKPENIMKTSHMSPLDAISAFNDLQGETFIPMHYGTYDLADEPLGEPIKLLKENEKSVKGIVKPLNIGEEYYFD